MLKLIRMRWNFSLISLGIVCTAVAVLSAVVGQQMRIAETVSSLHRPNTAVHFIAPPSSKDCSAADSWLELRNRAEWRDPGFSPTLWTSVRGRGLWLSVFVALSLPADGYKAPDNVLHSLTSPQLAAFDKAVWLLDAKDVDLDCLSDVSAIRLLCIESNSASDQAVVRVLKSKSCGDVQYVRVAGRQFSGRVVEPLLSNPGVRILELELGTLEGLPSLEDPFFANLDYFAIRLSQ